MASIPPQFPVVAVGASSGGVEAFRRLLGAVPADTGMAFVLIQHLDPRQPSHLTEAHGTATSMPVVEIEDGTRLAADHVFVVPPALDVTFVDGVFRTAAAPDARSRRLSIDLLLQTVAAAFGRMTVGVLLSGAGSDGVEGLREIQSAGGITFAQEPSSARVGSMPASAIAAGVADHVLAPEGIAEELARLSKAPYLSSPRDAVEEPAPEDGRAATLRKILVRVQEQTGTDLLEYKAATVERRLARRMALRRFTRMDEYLAFLESDAKEVHALLEDLLVHVTHFFRDAGIYAALQERVFPAILAAKQAGAPIRVWVPGCSSGEEVYSIAIALVEHLAESGRQAPIQIFGSDLSDATIERARNAVFAESVLREVSPERLERFFAPAAGGYRLQKVIRDLCVFAKHDVARDPPFSRVDLVSCRNTLIYFGAPLQHRVLRNLHYSLLQPGFLVLGSSESVAGVGDLFAPFDKNNKIFQRTPGPGQMAIARSVPNQGGSPRKPLEPVPRRSFDALLQRQVEGLVSRYAPPGVVVNARGEILLFRGRSIPYVEPATGQPTTNLFKMARGGLAAELRVSLKQAAETMVTVRREGLTISADAELRTFDLEISPIPGHLLDAQEPCFLVLFLEAGGAGPMRERPARPPAAATDHERLEHELATTKVYLQSLIDEQQRTGDELNEANDELVSTNEELQSTNEELETAKEELQSTNEELTTLNDELHGRNDQLTQANDDLMNLIGSVDIPIVILSRERKIRRFTPKAQRLMNLIPSDVGRSIDDIRFNLSTTEVDRLIAQALDTLGLVEADVQDRESRWCRLQVRPYRTADNRIDGVVLSVVDIDTLKTAVHSAERVSAYTTAIVEAVPVPLLVVNDALHVLTANRAFHRTFELDSATVMDRSLASLGQGAWSSPALLARLGRALGGERLEGDLVEHDFATVGPRTMEIHAEPIAWRDGERCLLIAIHDITARTLAERDRASALRRAEVARGLAEAAQGEAVRANRSKDVFLATLSHELRTPLTAILLSAERLKDLDAPTPERVHRAAAMIERGARAQAQLIDDLLDVSRIIVGKLHLNREPVDLAALVVTAVEPLRAQLERRMLRLEMSVPPFVGVVVGDVVRLQQVVWNLVTNAIKFTPEGGLIEIDLSAQGHTATLRVTDTGQGIASGQLQDVFGLFSQVDGATTRKKGGLGLGLAIVRHLVDLHGGSVRADSLGLGEGATLTVELPLSSTVDLPSGVLDPVLPNQDLTGIDVLVVEDDPATRELVFELLVGKGATVRASESVDQGLAAVLDRVPDVIFCDIALPDRDGYAFIAALRANPVARTASTPTFAVTALASDTDRARVLAAGFDGHVVKPVEIRRLAAIAVQATEARPAADPQPS
jgi:two-component system CheB/CheR fusion protein